MAHVKGQGMHASSKLPPLWWDRDQDRSARIIREDVRRAAQHLWPYLFRLAGRVVADAEFEAQELLENVVEAISNYLIRKNAPPQDPSGLVVVKFRQELYRAARKDRRLEIVGGDEDLAKLLQPRSSTSEIEAHLSFEEFAQALSDSSRRILKLRIEGYEWEEIAQSLHVNPSTLRNRFWRDWRRVFPLAQNRPRE